MVYRDISMISLRAVHPSQSGAALFQQHCRHASVKNGHYSHPATKYVAVRDQVAQHYLQGFSA